MELLSDGISLHADGVHICSFRPDAIALFCDGEWYGHTMEMSANPDWEITDGEIAIPLQIVARFMSQREGEAYSYVHTFGPYEDVHISTDELSGEFEAVMHWSAVILCHTGDGWIALYEAIKPCLSSEPSTDSDK